MLIVEPGMGGRLSRDSVSMIEQYHRYVDNNMIGKFTQIAKLVRESTIYSSEDEVEGSADIVCLEILWVDGSKSNLYVFLSYFLGEEGGNAIVSENIEALCASVGIEFPFHQKAINTPITDEQSPEFDINIDRYGLQLLDNGDWLDITTGRQLDPYEAKHFRQMRDLEDGIIPDE